MNFKKKLFGFLWMDYQQIAYYIDTFLKSSIKLEWMFFFFSRAWHPIIKETNFIYLLTYGKRYVLQWMLKLVVFPKES